MPNQQLVEYIRQARASGQNDVDIKNALLNAGWQEADVDGVFLNINLQTNKLTMTIQMSEFQNKFPLDAKRKFWKKIIASLPLAFVFSLFFGPLGGIGLAILIFGSHTDSLFLFIAFPVGAFLTLFIAHICLYAWYVKWYIKNIITRQIVIL